MHSRHGEFIAPPSADAFRPERRAGQGWRRRVRLALRRPIGRRTGTLTLVSTPSTAPDRPASENASWPILVAARSIAPTNGNRLSYVGVRPTVCDEGRETPEGLDLDCGRVHGAVVGGEARKGSPTPRPVGAVRPPGGSAAPLADGYISRRSPRREASIPGRSCSRSCVLSPAVWAPRRSATTRALCR